MLVSPVYKATKVSQYLHYTQVHISNLFLLARLHVPMKFSTTSQGMFILLESHQRLVLCCRHFQLLWRNGKSYFNITVIILSRVTTGVQGWADN